MADIRQLAPSVINKIAAGEVIERPASAVKELMENSIDAGASRVDVVLEQGGGQLVRVCDNGHGIRADQLRLAVASHATSKIRSADDLFRVGTLGFRGEALASIAEVSHFLLRSRAAGVDAGAQIELAGGQVQNEAPCGCPVGATVEVRNLFFNTPVRRKFLRTTQTELAHAAEAFTRIALARPQTHFTLRHHDRTVYELPPVESWRARIAALFGPELAEGLIPVEGGDQQARLAGYVAHPDFSRSNNRQQYLFLNGRYIRDRSLQHALGEAFRGLLLSGRCPIAFLRLQLPAEAVDVNVHPTKLEVRFQDGGRIYSHVLGAIRTKFLTTDLTAKVGSPPPPGSMPSGSMPAEAGLAGAAEHPGPGRAWGAAGPLSEGRQPPRPGQMPLPAAGPAAPERPGASWPRPAPAPARESPHAFPGGAPRGLQLHNRYLVTENEQGMVVIDQHALHERILYEQLQAKVLRGAVESQRLLAPEPVSLTPAEAAAALDARSTLAELGVEIEPFGGDTVLVSAYPAMLANLDPAEMLRQLVDRLMAGGKTLERRDLLDELLHALACKAAVKAGDRLSPDEVSALLQQRHLCQDAHHCPHGRPTALVFTNEELDKRFMRT